MTTDGAKPESQHQPMYRRILLKLSGEAFQGTKGYGIDSTVLKAIAAEVEDLVTLGVEVAMLTPGEFRTWPMPTYPEIRLARAMPGTIGAVAANAAMAGCLPDHLPVVLVVVGADVGGQQVEADPMQPHLHHRGGVVGAGGGHRARR